MSIICETPTITITEVIQLIFKVHSGTIDNASEVSERIKKSKNILKLFNTIACFIKDEHKNIEKEDQSAQEFMAGYATTIQLFAKIVKRILRLFRTAERSSKRCSIWIEFDDRILIPHLQKEVERIAWQIHIGQHAEWKPGGEEWRNIERFYSELGQRVTMTRLRVPARLVPAPYLRNIYVATRPVDASERNPWQYRRKETQERNSGTAGIIQATARYVPVSCQHWALVVGRGNTSAIWELGVVEGRIKIDNKLQYYPEHSRKMLIGYTAMSNDEISASAEVARKCMGDMYSFNTFNCQLFCNILFQFIRISHTMSDAFSDLHAVPDDCVVKIARKRLQQLGIIRVDASEVENLQPMPISFGTLYTRALIAVTALLLLYILINLGLVFFFLVVGIVVAWSPFAQRHTNLYPLLAKRDPDQRRLHHLYYADNTWKENVSGQSVAQSVGSQ